MNLVFNATRLLHTLGDSDLDLLASLKFHPGRYAVAEIYDHVRGAHHVLCGPGTPYPDWMQADVHTLLAVGEWAPGNPAFDRTLSLMRYEDVRHAGHRERHGIHLLDLGERLRFAEAAESEIARRAGERETWESMAA